MSIARTEIKDKSYNHSQNEICWNSNRTISDVPCHFFSASGHRSEERYSKLRYAIVSR